MTHICKTCKWHTTTTLPCNKDIPWSERRLLDGCGLYEEIVGDKHDLGKLRYDLLPVEALSEVVNVLTFGAEKYGDNNWKQVENKHRRYTAAAMRHGEAYRGGERLDTESNLHHLAHRICCDLFLIQTDIKNERF